MAKAAKKLVCGVGINDANYEVQVYHKVNGKRQHKWTCPYYDRWSKILKRCYSEKVQQRQPTYIGCLTAPEWHYFMPFRSWMMDQDWEGKHLDKDILFPSNKIYGPETCVFVSQAVNNFLTDCTASRGQYPIGVTFNKKLQKYQSRCSNLNSKNTHLGYFETPEEAHKAWVVYKLSQACILAAEQSDPRVAAALIARYENYK